MLGLLGWPGHRCISCEGEKKGRVKVTYCSSLGARKQEIKPLAIKPILLFRRHTPRIAHDFGKHPPITRILERRRNIPRDSHIHDLHNSFDILAQIVRHEGQQLRHLARQHIMPHHIRTGKEGFHPRREIRLPPFLRHETHRLAETILRNDIRSEAIERIFDIKHAFALQHLGTRLVRKVMHFGLQLEHLLATKEARQRRFAHAMQVVIDSGKARYGHGACAARVELVDPFIAGPPWASVDFVCEEGVGAVQFVGVDADIRPQSDTYVSTLREKVRLIYIPNNRSVGLVHVRNDFSIASDEPPVVVRFVQVRCGCDFGAGEVRERVQRGDVVDC
jgi:hypothetical protein